MDETMRCSQRWCRRAAAVLGLVLAGAAGVRAEEAAPGGQGLPSPDSVAKAFRGILAEAGIRSHGRPVAELDWPELRVAVREAGTSPVFLNSRLRALARERAWSLDPYENATAYLMNVVQFMDDAARGQLPQGLRAALAASEGGEDSGSTRRESIDGAVVAISMEEPGRFIRAIGETPGATLGADAATLFNIGSGATLEDIEYASALLRGHRPAGLSLDVDIGRKLTIEDVVDSNKGFREIRTAIQAEAGTDRAWRMRKDLTRPRGFFAGRFVKDHTGSWGVYSVPMDGAAAAYLTQLDRRTPERARWTGEGPVPLAKGTFGMVVRNLGPDGWMILERYFHRGQDVSGPLRGMVWEGQLDGLLDEKLKFARLVMGLARLREAGQLPPLGDRPSAGGR